MKKADANKNSTQKASIRVSSLCGDLKSQMDLFDNMEVGPTDEELATEKRKVLFTSLKDKIKTLSK